MEILDLVIEIMSGSCRIMHPMFGCCYLGCGRSMESVMDDAPFRHGHWHDGLETWKSS